MDYADRIAKSPARGSRKIAARSPRKIRRQIAFTHDLQIVPNRNGADVFCLGNLWPPRWGDWYAAVDRAPGFWPGLA